MPNATCPGCGAYDPGDDVCICCHFSPGEDTPPPKPTFTHWYHETSKERPQGVSMGAPSFGHKAKALSAAIVEVHRRMDLIAGETCQVTNSTQWAVVCKTIVRELLAALSDEYPNCRILEPQAKREMTSLIDEHLATSVRLVAGKVDVQTAKVDNFGWAGIANTLVESICAMHAAALAREKEFAKELDL